MSGTDPFSNTNPPVRNLLQHVFVPTLESDGTGTYNTKLSMLNVDNIVPPNPLLVATGNWESNNPLYQSSIAWSNDGQTWFKAEDFFGTTGASEGYGVAFNGSMWVVVGTGAKGSIGYSYDGKKWYPANNFFTDTTSVGFGSKVAWNGKIWVAVGRGVNGSICTSLDGITWNASVNDPFNGVSGGFANFIIWNNELQLWVAGGRTNIIPFVSYDGMVASSSDGINWFIGTNLSAPGEPVFNNRLPIFPIVPFYPGEGKDICWTGTRFIAVGQGTSSIYTSNDGKNWTAAIPANDYFNLGTANGVGTSVLYNGITTIAIGYQQPTQQNTIAISTDLGTTWSNAGITDFFKGGDPSQLTWTGNLWIAVGNGPSPTNKNTIATSPDGKTWTVAKTDFFAGGRVRGVASTNVWSRISGGNNNLYERIQKIEKSTFIASDVYLPGTVTRPSNINLANSRGNSVTIVPGGFFNVYIFPPVGTPPGLYVLIFTSQASTGTYSGSTTLYWDGTNVYGGYDYGTSIDIRVRIVGKIVQFHNESPAPIIMIFQFCRLS